MSLGGGGSFINTNQIIGAWASIQCGKTIHFSFIYFVQSHLIDDFIIFFYK